MSRYHFLFSDIDSPGDYDENWEEEESERCLPNLYFTRGCCLSTELEKVGFTLEFQMFHSFWKHFMEFPSFLEDKKSDMGM